MTNAEIQVGEYVRTKDGRIGKIISKKPVYENDKLDYYLYLTSLNEFFYTEKQIKECGWRTEKNIIDLIEVGDYVKIGDSLGNKEYLDDFYSCVCNVGIAKRKRKFIELDCGGDGTEFIFDTNLIKLIITHEQMKSMEYKVGREDD